MRKTVLLAAAAILLGAAPSIAHHAFSAEFDQSKPVKVRSFTPPAPTTWISTRHPSCLISCAEASKRAGNSQLRNDG